MGGHIGRAFATGKEPVMERVERLRGWLEAHRPSLFEWLRVYLGLALFVRGVAFFTYPSALAACWKAAGCRESW